MRVLLLDDAHISRLWLHESSPARPRMRLVILEQEEGKREERRLRRGIEKELYMRGFLR
jgi:hypothetical protein